jgi:TolB protein
VIDSDGSHPINLSKNPAMDGWPSWSPDGRHVAFASDRSGNHEIYLMNADGSDVRLVADLPGRNTSPHWSPDGKHLSFDHSFEGSLDIFLMEKVE